MKKVELLPAGAFVINKNVNEKIKGRFSMRVWDMFLELCDKDSILDIEQVVFKEVSLWQYANLLALTLNDYNMQSPKYSWVVVMDLIDEVFPLGCKDNDLVSIMKHGVGKPAHFPEMPLVPGCDGADVAEQKKKTLGIFQRLQFKQRAFAAGLKPTEYWNACLVDVLEVIQAHELNKIEHRRNTREITYIIYSALTDKKDMVDIVRFWPLPGDVLPSAKSARDSIMSRLAKKGVTISNDGKINVTH